MALPQGLTLIPEGLEEVKDSIPEGLSEIPEGLSLVEEGAERPRTVLTAPDEPFMLDAGPIESDTEGNFVPWVKAGAKGVAHAVTSTAPAMVNAAARQFADRGRALNEAGATGLLDSDVEIETPEYTQNFLKNLSGRLGVGVDVWKASGRPLELPTTATEGEKRAFNVGESLGLVGAAVPFGPVGGPIALGVGTSGLSYDEMIKAGVDPERAHKAAIVKGVAEAVPEFFSFRIGLSRNLPFLKKAIYGQVSEILGESATSATQLGADLWAMNPGASKEDIAAKYADEIGDTLQETVVQTLIQAPIQSAGFHAASKLSDLRVPAKETAQRILDRAKARIAKPAQAQPTPLSVKPEAGPALPKGLELVEEAPTQPRPSNIPGTEVPRVTITPEAAGPPGSLEQATAAALPTAERRTSGDVLRKHIDELAAKVAQGDETARQELHDTLMVDKVSGAHTQRAYDIIEKAEGSANFIMSTDVKGLHAIDTKLSQKAGDDYLRLLNKAYQDEGIPVYRYGEKSDEFLARFGTFQEANEAKKRIDKRFRESILEVPQEDGTSRYFTNLEFYTGIGGHYGEKNAHDNAFDKLYEAKRLAKSEPGYEREALPANLVELSPEDFAARQKAGWSEVSPAAEESAEVTSEKDLLELAGSFMIGRTRYDVYEGFMSYRPAGWSYDKAGQFLQKVASGEVTPTTDAQKRFVKKALEGAKDYQERASEYEREPVTSPAKTPKPEQTGFELGLKGKDLRAPEREGKPVTMEELPLGQAMKEARDREAQTEIPLEKTPKTQYAFSPGSKYEGYREGGEAMPAGTEKEPILRREPIIRKLMGDLEAALYEGRVKKKGRGGFYRSRIEEVRSRKKSDIETIGHEVAHMLDDRMPELKPAYKQFRDELKAVSYDKKSVSEGFAEFVRLWMTNKTVAAERTPRFNAWFNEFVKTSKYGKALTTAQAEMHKWFEQGEVKKLASKIGEQEKINEVLDGMGDRFRQAISDDLHGVYKMEREQTGQINPVGAYEVSRLARAAYAITDGSIQYGYPVVLPNGDHAFQGKGLKDILKPVSKDLDNWTYYAVARSANELFRQGRENLFSPSEIQAGLSLETPEFRQAFDEYQVWNRGILDFAEAKGLINPANRALWRRMEYLPFRREGQKGTGRKVKGVEGNWSGIRMLTGGTGNVRDILLNMTSNAANLISESLKNEARVKIADLAEKTKGGARFMTKIPKDTLPVSVDKQQIKAFVYQALGLNPRDVEAGNVPEEAIRYIEEIEKNLAEHPEFIQFWQMGQAPKGENVIAALRGGEPTFYEVADPVLYRAIASLNRPGRNWMVRFLGAIRQVGQTSITLSVDFMTANIARDTVSGAIMSRSGFRPFIDSIRGMKSRIMRNQDYKDFIANGGGLASYMLDEGQLRKHLEKFYSKKGLDTRTVLDTPSKIFYFLENLTDAFEVSTRIGEFKRAREKGETARHAAYQAREVSTDFAMRGDSQVAGFFYDTVMFLRAGVNGMDRLYRGFAHDPHKGNVAMKTGALAILSAALYMLNKDNDDYKDLPDWDKDNYWHFFFKGKHFRYPKIWEIGAMASVSERMMEQLFDQEASWKKYPQDVFRITTNLFKLSIIPQALSPLYEQATNKRGFSGTPIEQAWMEDLQPWARSHPQGSRILRSFGEAERNLPRSIQISPARVEALLQGYFNTWATYGLMLSDAAFYDDVPALRIDDYPGFRRFYAAGPAKHTKYEVMYWDMLKEATELRRTMRLMDKYPGSQDLADEIEAKHAPELEDYTQLENLQELLQDNRIGMTETIKDESLSPKQKRAELDKLIDQKNRILKEVMTEITQRKKERTK